MIYCPQLDSRGTFYDAQWVVTSTAVRSPKEGFDSTARTRSTTPSIWNTNELRCPPTVKAGIDDATRSFFGERREKGDVEADGFLISDTARRGSDAIEATHESNTRNTRTTAERNMCISIELRKYKISSIFSSRLQRPDRTDRMDRCTLRTNGDRRGSSGTDLRAFYAPVATSNPVAERDRRGHAAFADRERLLCRFSRLFPGVVTVGLVTALPLGSVPVFGRV